MPTAVVKDIVWEELGYEPHEAQREVHNDPRRMKVIVAGRRWGKSELGGNELIPEAIKTYSMLNDLDTLTKTGKREFWIAGPEYDDDDKEFRVTYDALKRQGFPFDKPGTYNDPLHGNMHISIWGGKFLVHTKSGRHADGMDGEGVTGILLVEAAKMKEIVFDKYVRPALADERGWALMTSTPEGKNWLYRKWQNGQNPKMPQWASWRMPAWLNPYIYPGGAADAEILEMKADMTEEMFKQEIEADFTEFVGQVFKDFDEELHVIDCPYFPDRPVYLATDYGWSSPWVCLAIQVDRFENVYVLDEYRVAKRDLFDILKDLQDRPLFRDAGLLFPEPADPEDTAVLQRGLNIRVNKNTGGRLPYRLDLIRRHLKMDPASEGHPAHLRKPKLFIDRKCSGQPLGDGGLIREMQEYRYPKTKSEAEGNPPELPMDKDNHGPEALGRFFRGYFGGPSDRVERSRARVRKAVIKS